jgi:Uma2 family endonuclease
VRADRFTKRRLYQAQQVPLYWVVDADAGSMEVWTPDQRLPVVGPRRLEWRPAGAGRALELGLDALFRPV